MADQTNAPETPPADFNGRDEKPSTWMKIKLRAGIAFWRPVDARVSVGLFLIAAVEVGLAPFFGWHLALFSLATSGVGIGLALLHFSLGVGGFAREISQLYKGELEKMGAPQRGTVAAPPTSWWRN